MTMTHPDVAPATIVPAGPRCARCHMLIRTQLPVS